MTAKTFGNPIAQCPRSYGRHDGGSCMQDDVLQSATCSRLRQRRCRRRRVCVAAARGSAPAASGDHAGADRGGQEGGQARLLYRHGPAVGGAARARRSRQKYPGITRARRALRRRARVSAHRTGVRRATSTPSTWSTRPTSALHRLEAQRLARALSAGGGRPALSSQTYYDPDGLHVTTRVWSRRSATTPIW